jgi:L-asparaginase
LQYINHPSAIVTEHAAPRVLIIYTGGTIGMVENPITKAHAPLNFAHLRSHVPELDLTHVTYNTVQFDPPLDSSNVSPEHWSRLAHIVADNYELYDGFVVLHGTDTMAYTASALSYMLENLNKPVVLTGSQLPIGVLRTDGKENLITAVEIAAARDRIGRAMVPEVCIYFQSSLMRGNRTKKLNAETFNAFASPNFPQIAEIGVHINYAHHYIRHVPSNEKLSPHFEMSTDVVVLKLFPGITRSVVHGILHLPGLRGVVMETFGTGNAMTDDWFISDLKQAIERGVVIVNASQCVGGAVEMSRYDAGNRMAQVGVIGSADMTTEATVTKLMFLLGQGLSQREVEEKMLQPLAGEMNARSLEWKTDPKL